MYSAYILFLLTRYIFVIRICNLFFPEPRLNSFELLWASLTQWLLLTFSYYDIMELLMPLISGILENYWTVERRKRNLTRKRKKLFVWQKKNRMINSFAESSASSSELMLWSFFLFSRKVCWLIFYKDLFVINARYLSQI